VRHFISVLTAVIFGLLLLPADALALRIAILDPYAEAAVPPALAAELANLTRAALIARGHEPVLSPSDNGEQCEDDACYLNHLTKAKADLAIVVSIFQMSGTATVSLVIFQPPEHSYYEAFEVGANTEAKVSTSLNRLFAAIATGPGPWLEVTGTPANATLFIDGQVVGSLPYRGRVLAGHHVLTLRAPLHAEQSFSTLVEGYANALTRRELALQPAGAPAPPATATDGRPGNEHGPRSRRLLGSGIALAVAGGTLLTLLRPLSEDGECRSDCDSPEPVVRNASMPRAALWTGVGVGSAALIAAVPLLVFGVREHRLGMSVEPQQASFFWKGNF
jgi:hypothetical protein